MTEMASGLVSIVMPAHNSERFLEDAVASVLAQSFQYWELLVIDDASTDQTLTIANEFANQDSRIRIIHLDVNGGVANARNVGIAAARGQYLAFLDSDDLWLPQKLQVQIEFMQREGIGFTFTGYRRLAVDGSAGRKLAVPVEVDYKRLLCGNVIGCLTAVVDRRQIAVLSMDAVGHEDYVAWLSILREGHKAHGIQMDLARYRVSSSSVSGDKRRSAVWTWKIYREIEKLSFPMAGWCFFRYCLRAFLNRLTR